MLSYCPFLFFFKIYLIEFKMQTRYFGGNMLRLRHDILKNWLLSILAKYLISVKLCTYKLHWCVIMVNFNFIEIKRLILLSFALFIKINVKKKIYFDKKMKLSPFSNILLNPKLFDLIILSNMFRRPWFPAHHNDRLDQISFLIPITNKWMVSGSIP